MHGLRTRLALGTAVLLLVSGNAVPAGTRAPGDLQPDIIILDGPICLTSNCNFFLEPGETVRFSPQWINTTPNPISTLGTIANFGGPGPAALYTINRAVASYDIPGGGMIRGCNQPCYELGLAAPAVRPAHHWDTTVGQTMGTGDMTTWTVHVAGSYADVPAASPFYRHIESLLHQGIDFGCAAGSYCPLAPMTREWMAPFVLVGREGRYFVPPACTLGEERFADVPATNPNCRWIEELARRNVVTGCAAGLYCPGLPVSREQMAVFTLVTLVGSSFVPPPCVAGSERFSDVPASSPFCRWIEELARRGVVTGCTTTEYCPTLVVSREQMSVFVGVTFRLDITFRFNPHVYLVNTSDDVDDGACSPAHCSLREAILAANATPNQFGLRDEIRFRLPGAGPHVIAPTSALPQVTEAVVIDGYTHPGAAPNTLGFGSGLDAVIQVELDLSASDGLALSDGSLVRGLAVNRSPFDGIAFRGSLNAIEGCFLGTDAAGVTALGNGRAGVYGHMFTSGNRVGGTLPIQRNLVSGNQSGIIIDTSSTNTVQGNLIGTDRSGATGLGNAFEGIGIYASVHLGFASDNVIGGRELGAGNVISANGGAGVRTSGIVGASVAIVGGTRIQANRIGFVAAGGTPLPNRTGLSIEQSGSWDTQIGGLSAGAPAGNAIAAQMNGIDLVPGINGGPHRTHIQGNLIRSSTFGVRGYPNPGGDVTGNVIGPNTASGIFLDGGQLRITANSIAGNGGLGIDLAPAGVTPNDPLDGDSGPNALQNYPVLASAVASGGVTTVAGTLGSAANTVYTVELFESAAPHATGFGEGAIYRGSVTVTTNASGTAPIAFTIPAAIPPGRVITATATDPQGNTSEFSAAIPVTQ